MNRTRLLTAAILVGALAWWLWPGRGSYDLTNDPPTAQGPWVAFGDSLTAGEGAREGESYPAQLSRRLGVDILNRGRRGDTTADGLARLQEVLDLEPRVVLLCFGGNDSLRRTPEEETFANLRQMIRQLQQEGSFVVLIGVRSASLTDQFKDRFADLARETGALHVPDILQGVLGRPSLMADYVHPTGEGYGVIAERLARELRPHVADW